MHSRWSYQRCSRDGGQFPRKIRSPVTHEAKLPVAKSHHNSRGFPRASIFPVHRKRKKQLEVEEFRKERELATARMSSADRTLLRRATRETRRRQVRKRGGVLARQETIEGVQRGQLSQSTTFLLTWRVLPVALQRVPALEELSFFRERKRERAREREGGSSLRRRPARGRRRDRGLERGRWWLLRREEMVREKLLAKRGIRCCWVRASQLGHEEIDLRVGGCRIIINWPLSRERVEDLGLSVSVSSCFALMPRP